MCEGDENGSSRSGESRDGSPREDDSWSKAEVVEGGRERRRTASRRVGWKSPPNSECAARWVGSTWPKVKKVDKNLLGAEWYQSLIE